MARPAQAVPSGPFRHPLWVDLPLVLAVLIILVPITELLMGHQGSRMAFTAALVEGRTLAINSWSYLLTVDYATVGDRILSDKAPGQPFLMVPFYVLGTWLGIKPVLPDLIQPQYFGHRMLWWLSTWSSAVPTAILAVLMRRAATRVSQSATAGLVAAVAMVASTMLLPFGTLLFGHALAACLVYAAWVAVDGGVDQPRQVSTQRMVLGGALAGFAVLVEYTAAIVVVLLGIQLLITHTRTVYAYIAGGVPFALLLGVYNWVAWGSPFSFSYSHSGSFSGHHAKGLFGIQLPDPGLTLQVLLGERGLFVMTPICLAGVIGLVMLLQEARTRRVALMSLAIVTAFILVQGGWSSVTAGASPGPRYVVPALGFLAIGVARFWQWSWPSAVLFSVIGAIPMGMAIMTNPLAQPTEPWATYFWFNRILEGRIAWTLLHYEMADWLVMAGSWIIAAGAITVAATAARTQGDAHGLLGPGMCTSMGRGSPGGSVASSRGPKGRGAGQAEGQRNPAVRQRRR